MKRSDFVAMLSAVPLFPRARPVAADFADSLALVRRIQTRDDASILPVARTALYDHGHPSETAVVLFHGFTNCPAQYALFAQRLHARGCNVLVPRLPEHGDVNRMTTRLERMTAEAVTAAASEAVDAARGLGRRLVVSGLSLGGALTAWLATQRGDIDRCVSVAPAFGIDHIWFPFSVYAAGAMRAMPPAVYAWWDPRLKEAITPRHAYPRYPLRALGECYKVGEWTIGAQAPLGGRARTELIFALNPRDPAVNDSVAAQLAQYWRSAGMLSSSVAWLEGFPAMHDVIEPENPHQCIAQCYPPLLDLILA
jgi:alpha-beta hydrolase superfamily lysophospholipase